MARKTSAAYDFPTSFYDLRNLLKKSYYVPEPSQLIDGQIVVVENFFKPNFCDELIRSFTTQLKMETTPLIKSRDYAARFNDRAAVNSNKAAIALWDYMRDILLQDPGYENPELEGIRKIFQNAKSLNPQLRMYRYVKGHHFGQHYDESVECAIAHEPKKKGHTKWTLLIYLTGDDEFSGGATIFYPDFGEPALSVHPSKGMALLHKHGDDCLRHEAEYVKSGVKWVLRSDVVF